jgi:hypothetical protein
MILETVNSDKIHKGQVYFTKRLPNSKNGNPRYEVVVRNLNNGGIYELTTKRDEGWVYAINWHNLQNKNIHYTMEGKRYPKYITRLFDEVSGIKFD